MTVSNEEIIFKEHDLKLAIQKEIIDQFDTILSTNDIGYTSWQIATQVVEKQKKISMGRRTKKINKFFKIFLDNTETKL